MQIIRPWAGGRPSQRPPSPGRRPRRAPERWAGIFSRLRRLAAANQPAERRHLLLPRQTPGQLPIAGEGHCTKAPRLLRSPHLDGRALPSPCVGAWGRRRRGRGAPEEQSPEPQRCPARRPPRGLDGGAPVRGSQGGGARGMPGAVGGGAACDSRQAGWPQTLEGPWRGGGARWPRGAGAPLQQRELQPARATSSTPTPFPGANLPCSLALPPASRLPPVEPPKRGHALCAARPPSEASASARMHRGLSRTDSEPGPSPRLFLHATCP